MKRVLCFVAAIWSAMPGMAAADRPFLPTLSLGRDHPLCESLQRHARERYDDQAALVSHRDDLDIAPIGEWTLLSELNLAYGRNEVALLDLSGTDGPTRYLMRHSRRHSWRGDLNAFVFVDSEQRARDWAEIITADGYDREPRFDFEAPPDGFTPVADYAHYFAINAPETAFVFQGEAYLILVHDTVRAETPSTIALERISPDGVERTCELVTAPAHRHLTAGLPAPMQAWVADLERMRGEPGMGFCGTGYGQFWGSADRFFYASLSDALLRPDLVKTPPHSRPRQSLSEATRLESWGRNDMRSWQISRRIQDGRAGALTALEAWFVEVYPEEAQMAPARARHAMSAAFDGAYMQTGLPLTPAEPRSGPLLRDGGEIAQAIDRFETGVDRNPWGAPPEAPMALLLDQPDALAALINAGEPVDAGNGFGKTALMMAAHLDMIVPAQLLLDAGADPNARTHDPQDAGQCYYGIRRHQRSALMYAVENAGSELVALLLAAGADPHAADSQGQTMWDYLARNDKVPTGEIASIRQVLIEAGLSPQ